MILRDLVLITRDNIKEHNLANRMIAYGESTSGYIAKAHWDPKDLYLINGLSIDFIFDNYDWVYLINEHTS